jgi:hypothetical protein
VPLQVTAAFPGAARSEPAGGRPDLAGVGVNRVGGTIDLSGAWRNP